MTEKIIAPDVYTSETDKSAIAPGQVSVGLSIIGPTEKGEAFVPTDVDSYSSFVSKFGSDASNTYVPYSVINYLQSGNSVKVTRVLGNGGWTFNDSDRKIAALVRPGTAAVNGTTGSLSLGTQFISGTWPENWLGDDHAVAVYLVGSSNFYYLRSDVIPPLPMPSNTIYYPSGSTVSASLHNFQVAVNASSSLHNITSSYTSGSAVFNFNSTITGSISNNYFYSSVIEDLNYYDAPIHFVSGSDPISSISSKILTVLHPSKNNNANIASLDNSSATGTNSSFNLILNGTQVNKTVSGSLNQSNSNYITKVLGTDENFATSSAFPYMNFNNFYISHVDPDSSVNLSLNDSVVSFTSNYNEGYDNSKTPWVLSDGGVKLFRFQHRSHGTKTNKDIKISITNILQNSDPEVYSTFNILVRSWNDTDKTPNILEQYTNVTLNPNSAAYIGRVIGDKYSEFDENQNKVVNHGNYSNISNYIRVEIQDSVEEAAIHANVIPNGFEAVTETIAGFTGYTLPTASMVYSNSGSSTYSGFDYSKTDNINYLNPVPVEATVGENINFTKPSNDNKFTIPLQGGTDGMNFATIRKIGNKISADGTNVFGFDLSTSTSGGTVAFNKAISILGNSKQYKFNVLTIPGVIDEYHSTVTAIAESMVEDRTDAIYIRDLTGQDTSIATAVNLAAGIDSSYSAAYYPWVKVRSISAPKDIFVPISVVIPQTLAYTDRTRGPWYAPAGLTQGALSGVIDTKVTLSKNDIETLYQAKINPLVKESGLGIVAWGQKTLQVANTSLGRINVRRLLIELRTYIADKSRQLVFEQNTTVTRNKFINMIDPYLSSIQQKEGLYAYRIYMDDTNNTAEIIDRNQLVGQIQLYPTKSVEFILLDFSINPTSGATNFNQ